MLYMDGIHKKIQNGAFCVTDVRDVAEAHIAPIEKDVGWGKRYIIIKAAPRFEESVGYIKEALENHDSDVAKSLLSNLPTEVNEELMPMTVGGPQDKPFLFDASPSINELGIKYRSVKEMVTANVNTLLENNFTGMKQYNPKSL